ncbi:MAG TPA: MASE3 domain-containing protein, partial [Usitatibacteraceae bacterium]|nr:MASE3 domain-containing protein [Usitatibacteraceae bacterium]
MDALIDRATETAGKRLARHVLAAQLQWPALAALCLVPIAAYNYLLFHTVVELVSVIVACSVFVIAWNAYPFSHNRFLLFLGTGLLWVSALDLFHALVYKGMDIVPGFAGANAPTQFWIGTRYLHALVLLAAPLFLVWPLKRWWAMLGNGMAACAVFAWLVSGHFPDAFVEGAGLTPFKIYSEYAIVAILALSLAFLWQRRTALDERIFVLVAASTAFVMAGELAFTKYASVYGQANLAGHLFRIVAYWLIYAALVDRALAQPFRMMARAATTYDAIPDATIVVDKEGVIRQVNGAARVQTGLPGQEAIGRDCHALFHPASVPRDACPACRCIREGTAAPSLELEDATGGRWVEISLAPVARGEDVTGMVHVSRDITERHNAERDKEVLIRSLNERMKELRCLYAISDLLERKGRDLPEVLAQIAALLPAAFQFPDITVARIACGAVERATPGFRRTSWRLGAGVTARGEPVGSVEVCYLEERPACDEGPFFDEERQLIDVVAERLGRIIERVRAEEQVARLTRLYATLSQTNQSIIRATDRSALFEEICRIACESGGFASAWISVGGSGADGFSVAASRGLDDADRALLAESAGNPEGHVARVLRTGESWFTNDYANDSATSRWHREETARGIAGCAIVPLRTGGAVAGLFGLYTREAAYFDDAQLALLEEMASDVSFALDNLEHERRRREGERALRESEERYRQVGASVLDGLIVIDDQGKITDWNSAAARIFSYTAAEAVGRDLHELVALSRYRDRYEAGLAHFRSSGQGAAIGKSLELTARRRDGSEFPVELSIAGFQWKGRWNAVGSVRDITDRVLAQKKLRFATAVVERSPTVLFRYRAEEGWPVEYVSENVRQVGYEAEELLSGAVSLASLIHPDDLGRVTDEMARHCASGAESFAQEYRIVTKGGAVLWVDDQTIVERDPAGTVTHFQGVVTDVTERRRAQQAELEQFRLAEAFFNHSVSAIAILDRDFNFVRVNDAYARGARKDIGEFAGRNHFEMYPSDAKAIFEEVVRTRRPYETTAREFTYPGQAERGKTYWDWTLVPILDRQGEVEYLVFSLQEVTERKLAEERQRAAALYARSLIEASLDPLITISPEGKVTDVNRMTEEATGVARAELI